METRKASFEKKVSTLKNEEIGIELPPEETIITQRRASYRKSWIRYVGGTLIITNEKIYFRPDKANTNRKILELTLDSIHVLRKANTFGVIPNRILVGDSQGNQHVFVVGKRNKVIEALENQLKQR